MDLIAFLLYIYFVYILIKHVYVTVLKMALNTFNTSATKYKYINHR